MTDLSESSKWPYKARHKSTVHHRGSCFDGHDARSIIMRRIFAIQRDEVIHLGHNRSIGEIVSAGLAGDVRASRSPAYRADHIEDFKYMIDLLRQNGPGNIKC